MTGVIRFLGESDREYNVRRHPPLLSAKMFALQFFQMETRMKQMEAFKRLAALNQVVGTPNPTSQLTVRDAVKDALMRKKGP